MGPARPLHTHELDALSQYEPVAHSLSFGVSKQVAPLYRLHVAESGSQYVERHWPLCSHEWPTSQTGSPHVLFLHTSPSRHCAVALHWPPSPARGLHCGSAAPVSQKDSSEHSLAPPLHDALSGRLHVRLGDPWHNSVLHSALLEHTSPTFLGLARHVRSTQS
jgi:hypothetical protein